MKYLSEWDQWKRYSSKSWKRFLEKAREMATHLELWRKDIRSIEGRARLLPASLRPSCSRACAHPLTAFPQAAEVGVGRIWITCLACKQLGCEPAEDFLPG